MAKSFMETCERGPVDIFGNFSVGSSPLGYINSTEIIESGQAGWTVTRSDDGKFNVNLNDDFHELVWAEAHLALPTTASGTVYGAEVPANGQAIDSGGNVVQIHTWKTAPGYQFELASSKVFFRLVLKRRG